ncbi:hypothetical protein [Gordonia rubripertincta]|uniref:hypothetical protein n=1 Tax=Gordonia rubripertincta TaxID=36822 RepID=UPI0015FCC335|nr:hypothetical protein [Gordonia rubripertincta]QMU22522.1 hypothetical protein H3V45_08665 [Gordonia rubripertincta]
MAANCGTKRGYEDHRSAKEIACEPCRLAHNRDQKARTIRSGRQDSIRVPVALLAELYLSAPLDIQTRADGELGVEVCDALVDIHDAIEDARTQAGAA